MNTKYLNNVISADPIIWDEILIAIGERNSTRSMGADNIPAYIVKAAREIFVSQFLKIFDTTLDTVVFQVHGKYLKLFQWKKGSIANVTNYNNDYWPIAVY